MIKKIKFLLLDKFCKILPLGSYYFMLVSKPKKVKLTRDLIYINFSNYSIFKNSEILYLEDGDRIYLWFIDRDFLIKNKFKQKIFIPEGLLISKALNDDNVIIVLKKDNDLFCIVKKSNIIQTEIKININEKDNYLSILKKKYKINNIKYYDNLNTIFFHIKIKDFIKDLKGLILNQVDIKQQIYTISDIIIVPLIILFIGLGIDKILYYSYINKKINIISKELNIIEHKNKSIKSKYNYLEKENFFWKNFKKEELSSPSFFLTLNSVFLALKNSNAQLRFFSKNSNLVNIIVSGTSTSKLIKNLLSLNIVKEVSVLNNSIQNNKEIVNIKVILK